jgi:hypothetical protein
VAGATKEPTTSLDRVPARQMLTYYATGPCNLFGDDGEAC